MERFRWKSDGSLPGAERVSERFRLSAEKAPRLWEVKSPEEVALPVVDMAGGDEAWVAGEVARASEEFGFFMVTNHGVPEEVWRRAAESVRGVFLLPPEIKSQFPGLDAPSNAFRLFNFFRRDWPDNRRVYTWSEKLHHIWHPLHHNFTADYPDHLPPAYRENTVAYAKEMGVLMTRLLRLLSRGLGLEDVYLEKRLGEQPYYRIAGNYFPPCPEPDKTLGLNNHSDSLLLGIVRSMDEVPGLQIFKDNHWVGVQQLPNSFIVNIGDQLQVLSNKRYKSVLHRVTVNKSTERVTLAYFCGPDANATIGPIEDLIDDEHPAVYKSYLFKEFMELYEKQLGKNGNMTEVFSVNPTR